MEAREEGRQLLEVHPGEKQRDHAVPGLTGVSVERIVHLGPDPAVDTALAHEHREGGGGLQLLLELRGEGEPGLERPAVLRAPHLEPRVAQGDGERPRDGYVIAGVAEEVHAPQS